ncbi:MAG TPA: cbb3-type cytochrome oxidase assembly protein CcoS [Aequorivita sp.]|nr:cbb3-type cytochrome oxidase assembly protein CcoS [Aequorivita sp.]
MNIIYILLAISVFVAIFFFVAFLYSVRKGQFDDTHTPAIRMLFEDELVKDVNAKSDTTSKSTVNSSKK